MADLAHLLDIADLAVARAHGVVPEDTLADIAASVRDVRRRNGYLGEHLVVALAGATGSGKSSLVNRLVSYDVVDVGVVRPTTSRATAIVPADARPSLRGLLAMLEVDDVIEVDQPSSTVLVDLPDFDSVETAHRHVVERVLPTVDAVLWVLDPEKYADPTVHQEFLRGLVRYEQQFIFVVNQADRLGRDAEAVRSHCASLLRQDGFSNPTVATSSTVTPDGVDGVASLLAGRFDAKRTVVTKAASDLGALANGAWAVCARRAQMSEVPEDRFTSALAGATFVSLGVETHVYIAAVMGDDHA